MEFHSTITSLNGWKYFSYISKDQVGRECLKRKNCKNVLIEDGRDIIKRN